MISFYLLSCSVQSGIIFIYDDDRHNQSLSHFQEKFLDRNMLAYLLPLYILIITQFEN